MLQIFPPATCYISRASVSDIARRHDYTNVPCRLTGLQQEFLNEMLDALHEDVNRVIDKPYVAAPDDDETESGKSDQQLADEAWDRHVQRNRSVIVDLFYGQLKMECRCPVCNKKVCLSFCGVCCFRSYCRVPMSSLLSCCLVPMLFAQAL